MRLFMPIVMAVVFMCYIFYLFLAKKNLKQQADKVVYPGLFFIVAWVAIYFEFLV